MRLLPGETIVGAAVTAADAEVLLISALGQLKKLAVSNLRLCQRGDLGEIALRFSNRNDQLVDLRACDIEMVAVETQTGSIRLQTDNLLAEDSRGTGLNLELPKAEKVTRLLPLNNQL
jgi:DNA gyrase subunit A